MIREAIPHLASPKRRIHAIDKRAFQIPARTDSTHALARGAELTTVRDNPARLDLDHLDLPARRRGQTGAADQPRLR